jgi:hypothetical protein
MPSQRFDTMELPFLFGAIQFAAEPFCHLSCDLNAAYVEEELDRFASRG